MKPDVNYCTTSYYTHHKKLQARNPTSEKPAHWYLRTFTVRNNILGFLKLSASLPFSLVVRPWGKSRIWIYCLSWAKIPVLTPYKAEKKPHWLTEFTMSLLILLDCT